MEARLRDDTAALDAAAGDDLHRGSRFVERDHAGVGRDATSTAPAPIIVMWSVKVGVGTRSSTTPSSAAICRACLRRGWRRAPRAAGGRDVAATLANRLNFGRVMSDWLKYFPREP
jgi:hypothetical protein